MGDGHYSEENTKNSNLSVYFGFIQDFVEVCFSFS
jgi:hypothetical protein